MVIYKDKEGIILKKNLSEYQSTTDPDVADEIIEDIFQLKMDDRYQNLSFYKTLLTVQRCPYCGGEVKQVSIDDFYERDFDTNGVVYVCCNYPLCSGYVGSLINTVVPAGTLADNTLRNLRKRVLKMVNQVKEQGTSWKIIMESLSFELDIPDTGVVFGMFTDSMCRKAFDILEPMIIKTDDFYNLLELDIGERIE